MCLKWDDIRGWPRKYFYWIVLAFFALALTFAVFAGGDYGWVNEKIEDLSKGIARIDDLILRVLGLGLLVWAVALFIRDIREIRKEIPLEKNAAKNDENNKGEEIKDPLFSAVRPYIALIRFAAVLGLSGASLFGSYELDKLDKEAYPPKGSSIPPIVVSPMPAKHNVLARWVQVIPAEEKCQLSPVADGKGDKDAVSLDCKVGLLADRKSVV